MKTVLLVLLILFCCVFSVSAQKESASLDKVQFDIYQVYKAVLKELFIKPHTKQIAIRHLTSGAKTSNSNAVEKHNLIELVTESLSIESKIVDNYQAINLKPSELKDEFELEVPTILLNEKGLNETLKEIKENYPKDEVNEKFKEFFKQRYKGMAFTFSNIGFNNQRNQALLHVEYDVGGFRNDCMGMYVFLIKDSNSWTIKKQMVSWIS